jgi:hypothetical protein
MRIKNRNIINEFAQVSNYEFRFFQIMSLDFFVLFLIIEISKGKARNEERTSMAIQTNGNLHSSGDKLIGRHVQNADSNRRLRLKEKNVEL